VNTSRGLLVLVVGALLLAACGEANAQNSAVAAESAASEVPAQTSDTQDTDVSSAPSEQDTETLLAAVAAECASTTAKDLTSVDLDERIFRGPDLRCADMSGSTLLNSDAGDLLAAAADELGRLDFSGANFTGADLRGATLSITAVGANFTGADLRGVDFTDSDLRGALFVGAQLEGSSMTSFAGGLERADLSGAALGCNQITASPRMTFTGVTVSSECGASSSYQWLTMTLDGDLEGSLLDGLDFTSIVVGARNFRQTSLISANISDKGVFPDDADFGGANLSGANLSATGFHGTNFEEANLSGANLTDTYFENVTAQGAVFTSATMTGFLDVDGNYAYVDFSSAVLDNALLTRTSLLGADLRTVSKVDLVLDDVTCPSSNSSLDSLGTCNFRDDPLELLADE